jgi:hypothetical protein
MGYKRTKKTYTLIFEDPEMEGLEVKATTSSMADFMAIQRQLMKLQANPGLVEEDLETLDDLFGRFSKVLTSWNLEDDDDKPVPPTKEGLLAQDPEFVMQIIAAWTDAVGGVDPELGKGSPSGPSFPEVNIPMDPLSSAPGSLLKLS